MKRCSLRALSPRAYWQTQNCFHPPTRAFSHQGEFHGHMHSTMHGVWGVAHLGAVLQETRYIAWAKRVYDYASGFGPGTGWIQAALWNEPVRELSETCATSDMVSVASWIAQGGFPEYWDHVERALRNYLRPQQFFVTAEYEALYRKINADKSAKEIEAGLSRMRELQGAVLGGPGPNDWINWIASEKQCGPYATPYGCMSMFGCCAPEGMRALHTVWSGIVKEKPGQVYVNMTLNRKSSAADVISSLPDHGRMDVIARKAGTYYLRPPAWAPRDAVRVARSAIEAKPNWSGEGLAYLRFANVRRGEVLTLSYPLVDFRQTWGNWPSRPELKLTISWRGNSVTDMEPRGKGLPINFSQLPPIPGYSGMTNTVLEKDTIGARAIRRVRARVLPFFCVLYIIAYIDRANVAFAKLVHVRRP